MKQRTLLLTSVGSLLSQNILDALEGRRSGLRIIGANSLCEAAGNFRCDRAYLLPPAAEEQAYRQELASLIEREAVDLAIPGRDDDILALAQLRLDRPEWEARLLAGTLEAAQAMDDKVKSYAFAQASKLPFAWTISSDAPDAPQAAALMVARHGFPLIAKPRRGNGSRGVRILQTVAQLERNLARPGMAIQPMYDLDSDVGLDLGEGLPFFWGIPESRLYAAQMLIQRDGSVGPGIGFTIAMVAGRCERLTRCDDADLLATARAYAESIAAQGWRGPFNLELKRDSQQVLQAIEMNGRFTGGTSARRHLGFDELGLTLNHWLGDGTIPLAARPVGEVEVILKSLSDFALPREHVETLRRTRAWTA